MEIIYTGSESLPYVDKFCYLDDMFSARSGAKARFVVRVTNGPWELIFLLTVIILSMHMKGKTAHFDPMQV